MRKTKKHGEAVWMIKFWFLLMGGTFVALHLLRGVFQ